MYEGPSLAHCFDFVGDVDPLLRDLVDEAGERLTEHIRELTPIGSRPFEPDYVPGRLRESIAKQLTVVYFDAVRVAMVYETAASSSVSYAPYVEHGTGVWGPYRRFYEIRPKNPDGWLRFVNESGVVVFAKRVIHQGSPGAHMFARGAVATEAEFEEWAGRRVERWAKERELQIVVRGREKVLLS